MTQRIARDVMDLVAWICEMPTPRLGGIVMNDEYPEVGPRAIRCGALHRGPDRKSVPDRYDDDARVMTVEWDQDTRSHRYFSCAGRWETVPKGDMYTWDLDLAWLVGWLGDQFGQAFRTTPPILVENHLWDLGVTRIGRRRCGLFFTRRLRFGKIYDQVVDALRARSGHPAGILITTSPWSVRNAKFPHNHRVVRLKDALDQEVAAAKIDLKVIESTLDGTSPALNVGPIQCSSDGGAVTIDGRTFTFRGVKQRGVIQCLVDARYLGDKKVRIETVLEAARSNAGHIQKLFKGHPDWQDLIGYGGGYCWLRV